MSIASFGRNTSKLRALLGIRARLVILALILVVPLMLDRVRILEVTRSKQIAQAAHELSELAKHTADAQREIISTVQAVLKSSAYIYATAAQQGRVAPSCAPACVDLPWIRSLNLVDSNGTIQCSTQSAFIGANIRDRDYFQRAMETHEFVVSDYIVARPSGTPTIIAAYPVSAIEGNSEALSLPRST
jgi:hypothetical protein